MLFREGAMAELVPFDRFVSLKLALHWINYSSLQPQITIHCVSFPSRKSIHIIVNVWVMLHGAIYRQPVPGNLIEENPFTFECSQNFLENRKTFSLEITIATKVVL